MTKAETERLAKVEQKVDDLKESVQEIKEMQRSILTKLEEQDKKFVDKKTVKWLVGFIVSLVALGIAFANWLRG